MIYCKRNAAVRESVARNQLITGTLFGQSKYYSIDWMIYGPQQLQDNEFRAPLAGPENPFTKGIGQVSGIS